MQVLRPKPKPAWTYEAKAIKIRCQGASRPWPGLENYITGIEAVQVL